MPKLPISDVENAPTGQKRKYAEWLALPKHERVPLRRKQLADELGVSERTLGNWKNEPEVQAYRDNLLRERMKDALPGVIEAHLNKAQGGSFLHQKLLYEMLGWYKEESNQNIKGTLKIEVEYVDGDTPQTR